MFQSTDAEAIRDSRLQTVFVITEIFLRSHVAVRVKPDSLTVEFQNVGKFRHMKQERETTNKAPEKWNCARNETLMDFFEFVGNFAAIFSKYDSLFSCCIGGAVMRRFIEIAWASLQSAKFSLSVRKIYSQSATFYNFLINRREKSIKSLAECLLGDRTLLLAPQELWLFRFFMFSVAFDI